LNKSAKKEKVYIEYPIAKACGLRCEYCFHRPLWEYEARCPDDKYSDKCAFTFAQYKAWRDKHIPSAEILMELHGGEMSFGDNQQLVLDIIDSADKERFQLQTNGLGSEEFYRELVKRKDKIDRIGFTFHRKAHPGRLVFVDTALMYDFARNVKLVAQSGINVYIKELLFLDRKEEVLRNKKYWESQGVEFRIQDFKGMGGNYATESAKYTAEDWALVHPEYRHGGDCCHCREGYRQIIIRGYDQRAGDVLACWQDHKVIGNILEDWYEPHEKVLIDPAAPRGRTVVGRGRYSGDYMHDLKLNELEKKYYPLFPKEFKMLAKLEAGLERLGKMLAENEALNAQDKQRIEQAQIVISDAQKRIGERTLTIVAVKGGIEMTNVYINEAKAEAGKGAAVPGESQDILNPDEVAAIHDYAEKALAADKKKGRGKAKGAPVVPPRYGDSPSKDYDPGSVN